MGDLRAGPPRGIWAIGDRLSPETAPAWGARVRGAAAWTLRRPRGGDRAALRCALELRRDAPWLAVHARSDLAVLAHAEAVIAGVRSLPLRVLGERCATRGLHCGASVHDAAQAHAAEAAGAGFLIVGAVWPTASKSQPVEPCGLELVEQLAAASLPVVAVGGIDRPERVVQAAQAGAHAVAVLGATADRGQFAELLAAWPRTAR